MRHAITIGMLAAALFFTDCSRPKTQEKPQISEPLKKEEIDKTLYSEESEKKYLLPSNFYMIDHMMINDKSRLDTLIKKAEHDLAFLKWNYGFNDIYAFGIPKQNQDGTDMEEDKKGFNKNPKKQQIEEFRRFCKERKYEIDREIIEEVEREYSHIGVSDYQRIKAENPFKFIELAKETEGMNINKIFYNADYEQSIMVLYWDKDKSLSLKKVPITLEDKNDLVTQVRKLESEPKKLDLFGALYIPHSQYQKIKDLAKRDSYAQNIFSQIESNLSMNDPNSFISVNKTKSGMKLFKAGREITTEKADIPMDGYDLLKRYQQMASDE